MQNVRTFRRTFLLATAGIVTVGTVNVPRAQAPATRATPPTFEVASIKPSKSLDGGGTAAFQPGGRFRSINVPLQGLIATAFGTERPLLYLQIVGGPDWIATDRFDITAKMGSDASQDMKELYRQMPVLLRTLLEDRFKLKTHSETRQLPVYTLVLDRKDGRLGPPLRRSVFDCLARSKAARAGTPGPAPPHDRPACGVRFGAGTLSASGFTLVNLAGTLSGNVGRVVLDRTGLTGDFDVELQWTPDRVPFAGDASTNPAPSADGPSIFTALQEQLGLKLESTKGPVDVLVVDHVEQPTPN
jgi:uncharacterized protein (TIGR03435 family)